MDKKIIESKFSEYLNSQGVDPKKLNETTKRFGCNNIFDIFISGFKDYEKNPRYYKQVFNEFVLPQMKMKIDKNFGKIYFKQKTFEKYQMLFVNFMNFCNENKEFINNILFLEKGEKLENTVDGNYTNYLNKKAVIHAWHNYIKNDKGENGDKFREYLVDIYGFLNNEQLNNLYDVFFDSYKICSDISKENSENKDNENYKRKNAFDESFLHLTENLGYIKGETLNKIKSLFGKFLNFLPRYRKELLDTLTTGKDGEDGQGKTKKGKKVGGETDEDLNDNKDEIVDNKEKKETINTEKIYPIEGNLGIEGDGFGPIEIVDTSRDENKGVYDQTARGDIIAPIDYGVFDDE